jgi:adenylylsulfate kinase
MTGTVYWITGLAGAGKTTVAHLLHLYIRARRPNVVLLDGDILREVYGDDLGHDQNDRRQVAWRNARLCLILSSQGIDVVCATISMFKEIRAWNREHIPSYREVYLRVPMSVLVERDQKGLYSRALAGETENVLGVDIHPEEPEAPDLVIDNDGSITPTQIVEKCVHCFSIE